ncbi:MAG: FUSC family protein [Gammaproteobacteria bacterium]|nr:FUSC family protein [Gammaproteobacteria bacterium]MBU1601565.1 FUSC family protein [Gammaproteobacteria bacterium]MBU2434643.1 FUSC family protein [Gammaproteobacteria bacterium]MBU2447884.1 FUSC family protein [Gammaproteobacteria bacterium]
MDRRGWEKFRARLRSEVHHLARLNPSDRRWPVPFCGALAIGLPLFVGAWFDHLDYGLISSMGGLAFLYMPATPLAHRLVALMASAFGLCSCYILGLMTHFMPLLFVPVLTFIAIAVSMLCRYFMVAPPGSLFFVMAAAIGAYSPVEFLQIPTFVGLLTMGSLLACLIGFLYSLYALRLAPAQPVPPLPPLNVDFVVFDSLVIGVFVGISLVLAQLFALDRPYWVPVSCLAVIQGASLRAVWSKQVHRIAGTAIGLIVAWGLLMLPLDRWSVSLMMMALAFIIETLVVRHYGLAVVFITPLTILLADAAQLGHGASTVILEARLVDTVLGSVVGLVGGFCLHSPAFREKLGRHVRRLWPSGSAS